MVVLQVLAVRKCKHKDSFLEVSPMEINTCLAATK